MNSPSYKPVADHALLVTFGDKISDDLNQTVVAADKAIIAADIKGIREITPALVNLLVIFDPLVTDHHSVETALREILPPPAQDGANKTAHHTVGVCYDAPLCPDLAAVAKACDMSEDAVIRAHLSGTYRAAMYGFAPGYAYLSGVPSDIQVPRKPAPVRGIPAGPVMIAGPQCLCTTIVMPTGWSIIGRTNAAIMRDDPDKPFLFDVGDTISFTQISRNALGPLKDQPDV